MKPTNINEINATATGGSHSRMSANQQQQQQQQQQRQQQRSKQQSLILHGLPCLVTSMASQCEEYTVLDYLAAALDITNGIGTESTTMMETKPQLQ
ncbi:hypothetical protein IV203_019061 [Nitzschia inconspicua]|uniref:Uncharacterized protein n=1 Tax=Nitzschia inconspicua TaxID=303405 RepID=A0A9K3M0C0_9STRA|nr:hypothetical protein IV203_019061 [Nitzschia inconspicua]